MRKMYNLALMKKSVDIYISELLFLHDCVIIPEFGGFVGNNRSATLNEISGTIYPPSKEILFNKNLNKNDGLLINHIALSERITNDESKNILSDFVNKINTRLKTVRTFRIEKVGLFSVGLDNNILFLQDSFINYNMNSFGLSSEKSKKTNKIEKEVEKIITPISTKEGRRKSWRAAAILIPIIGLSLISITQEDKINNIYSQMATMNPLSVFETENKEVEDTKQIEETSEIKIVPEITETKEIVVKEIVIEEKSLEKKYFIIAGSFGEEENANRLVKQLQSESFDAEIIGTNKNGLFRVAFDGFTTKEEALISLQKLKSDNKSGWILSL